MTSTRKWRNYDVDINLRNNWLERLNALICLDLRSICEGHLDLPPDNYNAATRNPHMRLELKRNLAGRTDEVRSHREDLETLIQSLDSLSGTAADCGVGLGENSEYAYLTIGLNAVRRRTTDEREPWVDEWFERTIAEVETVDRHLATLLSVQ